MIKRLVLVIAIVAAMLAVRPASAEDVCLDGGAVGPLPVELPTLCVPVP